MHPLFAVWSLPLLAELNWSDLLYGLIPILYIVSQFLGSKREDKDKEGQQGRPELDEAERAERRRRIQEEIRRRVTGEEPHPEAGAGTRHAQSAEEPESVPRAAEARRSAPSPEAQPPRAEAVETRSFEADGFGGSDIERRLAQQHEELENARLAHQAARQRAADITEGALGKMGERPVYGASTKGPSVIRKEVLHTLKSGGENVRSALVLSEILGPPVAERSETDGRLF